METDNRKLVIVAVVLVCMAWVGFSLKPGELADKISNGIVAKEVKGDK